MLKYLMIPILFIAYSCANPSADSLCKENPCKEPHKTVCKVRGKSFVCLCEDGYHEKYGTCIKKETPSQDPCIPNPCDMKNRNICNSDNGFPVCLCNSGYHDENGECINNIKTVTCRPNENLPKNSHEKTEEIQIIYSDGQWQNTPYCQIECDEGYSKDDNGECVSDEVNPCANINCGEHSSCDAGNCICDSGYHEENGTCKPNSKEVDCNTSNTPQNATATITQVQITYTEDGWTIPEDCEWSCNDGYHKEGNNCIEDGITCSENEHEENGICKPNSKEVDCSTSNTPQNATAIITQVQITYTNEGGWTIPEDCEWSCNDGYHRENNQCSSNTKLVDCNTSGIPQNSTAIITQVQITYTSEGGWSIPEDCEWSCNDGYHRENNQCSSNTKLVDCDSSDTPQNATAVITQVQITYTDENGWSEPESCDWNCSEGYHKEGNSCMEDGLNCAENEHEEDGECRPDTKEVQCDSSNIPQNATAVITQVQITYTDENGWSEPESCDWNCNEGYHQEGSNCIENGTISCDDEFESNNTYQTAKLIEDANARDSQYTNLTICEGDEDWYKIISQENSGLEVDVNYTHVQDSCDIDVKLYKLVNGELRQVDSSTYSTGRETVYVRNTQTSETYYIKVYGFKSDCSSPYSLTANIFNNCIDDEENYSVAEQDDVISEAKTFNLFTSYNRMICDYDDDWYMYYFNNGDLIRITLDLINENGDLDIFLYGPDSSSIKGTYGTNDREIIDYEVTEDGYYYIKVRGWGFSSSNSYTFRVIKKEVLFDTGEQNYPLEDEACKVFIADFADQIEIDNATIKSMKIKKLLLTHEYLSDINIYLAVGDENYTQIWQRNTSPSMTKDNDRDDDIENDEDIDLIERSYENFIDKPLGDKKLRLKVCDDYSGDTGVLKRLFFQIKYDKAEE